MMKKCMLAVALLSLALAGGCAKGGNGAGNGITITVSDKDASGNNITAIYVTQSVQFKADVTGTSNTAVAWTLSGQACTGNPNPCGTINVDTGLYQAPTTAPSPSSVLITATSRADSTARGNLGIHVVPVTVTVAPASTVDVGHGLVQQFTATALPDDAPQTFTWTCTQNGGACANFVANTSGVAVYTAAESPCSGCVTVSAVSSIDPTGCAGNPKACTSKVTVLASRLAPGNYAFRFSGFDGSNNPVAVAGSITVSSGGAISGVESELTSSGHVQNPITGGSYTPSTVNDNNTNNAGTLRLTTGAFPNQYQVVLDASGDFQMIESDGHGTGSGVMQRSSTAQFNTAAQTFVFGFTGVDLSGKRVGYAGVLPMDGNGQLKTGGQLDTNDNGATNSLGCNQPCSVGGSYQYNSSTGLGQLTLTTTVTQHFDFFVSSGQTKNAPNPLTLYAISTDPVDATHPAISGSMVFQDPNTTYDKTALNAYSVSNLTGVDSTGANTLVSLISGSGNSNGSIDQTFDANNAGAIVPAATAASTCPYTTGTGGRYVLTLLGTGTTCTGGLPFVFYASGANRGFLLDQSTAAVMTGAMDPQDGNVIDPSQLPGTYAAATVNSATSGATPMAANLLLTFLDPQTKNVGGTQYPGTQTMTGSYTFTFNGTGTIALTAPAAANYVIYAIDASHFEMIDVDTPVTNPSVIFAQQ